MSEHPSGAAKYVLMEAIRAERKASIKCDGKSTKIVQFCNKYNQDTPVEVFLSPEASKFMKTRIIGVLAKMIGSNMYTTIQSHFSTVVGGDRCRIVCANSYQTRSFTLCIIVYLDIHGVSKIGFAVYQHCTCCPSTSDVNRRRSAEYLLHEEDRQSVDEYLEKHFRPVA